MTARPPQRPALRTALALGLGLAAASALGGCSAKAEKAALPAAAAAARSVKVGKPATRIETGLARATGQIRSREEAVLSARGTGQIRRILVGVGDRVRKGQALVEMDAALLAIGLENARATERLASAALASADKDLARGKSLHAQESLPDSAWEKLQTQRDVAAAQLDQARAALRAAEQQLADATLVAPFDGTITAKLRNAGDTVTLMPVSPILALTDLDRLEARLAVPETVEGFVRAGARVQGTTTPGAVAFEARVRVKNAVVDPASRTVEVLADVVRAEGLRPGTLVQVDFGGLGGAAGAAGLFVPTTAVRGEGKDTFVFVVAAGKAEKRAVEVTPIHPGAVRVGKGLDAQSDVILDPGGLAGGEAVQALAN